MDVAKKSFEPVLDGYDETMDPVYYVTMASVVLAEILICLYLLRPQWLSASRRWRIACLYGIYLCACSMLFVPAAYSAKIQPYRDGTILRSAPAPAPVAPRAVEAV